MPNPQNTVTKAELSPSTCVCRRSCRRGLLVRCSNVRKEQSCAEGGLSCRRPARGEGDPKPPGTGQTRCCCDRGAGCRVTLGFCLPDFSGSVFAAVVALCRAHVAPWRCLSLQTKHCFFSCLCFSSLFQFNCCVPASG